MGNVKAMAEHELILLKEETDEAIAIYKITNTNTKTNSLQKC